MLLARSLGKGSDELMLPARRSATVHNCLADRHGAAAVFHDRNQFLMLVQWTLLSFLITMLLATTLKSVVQMLEKRAGEAMGARATIAVCLVDVVRHQIVLLVAVSVGLGHDLVEAATLIALGAVEHFLKLAQPALVALQMRLRTRGVVALHKNDPAILASCFVHSADLVYAELRENPWHHAPPPRNSRVAAAASRRS